MNLFLTNLLSLQSPEALAKFDVENSENVLISCLKDGGLKARFYKCEIGSLSFVLALLAKFAEPVKFAQLDEGYLSAESCFGEEEASEVLEFLGVAEKIIIDESFKNDKNYETMSYFLKLLADKFDLEIYDEKGVLLDFSKVLFNELKELDNFDGLVLFNANLNDDFLHASGQFLQIAKVSNNDKIEVLGDDFKFETKIVLDDNLSSTIALAKYGKIGFSKVRIKGVK